FAPVADHRELVVDGLIARGLNLAAEKAVDEGRLARGERAEHADQRPPCDLHRERLVPIEQPEPVRDDVEAAEAAGDIEEIRILALEMRREPVEMLLQRERRGFWHSTSLVSGNGRTRARSQYNVRRSPAPDVVCD